MARYKITALTVICMSMAIASPFENVTSIAFATNLKRYNFSQEEANKEIIHRKYFKSKTQSRKMKNQKVIYKHRKN